MICAAGNDSRDRVVFPAYLQKTISVGAVDRCGIRSGRIDSVPNSCDPWDPRGQDGSNYGFDLDIVAPGTNVLTLDRQDTLGYNKTPGVAGDYIIGSGTSLAAPHVAGVVALMLSVNPLLNVFTIENILETTAQRVGGYNYQNPPPERNKPFNGTWHEEMGHGLVDAGAAVQMSDYLNRVVDLMVRDAVDDIGLEPNTRTNSINWRSPDIWIRNQQDGIEEHENPNYDGNPAYVYVRVRNVGLLDFQGGDQLKLSWTKASTGLSYPQPWDGYTTPSGIPLGGEIGVMSIPYINAGDDVILEFTWMPPNPADYSYSQFSDPWHFCLLAEIETSEDPITFPIDNDGFWKYLINNNNAALKNISSIRSSSTSTGAVVSVGNLSDNDMLSHLQLSSSDESSCNFDGAEITVELDEALFDVWVRSGNEIVDMEEIGERLFLITGENASFRNLLFQPHEMGLLCLRFKFLIDHMNDEEEMCAFHVIQVNAETDIPIGGETYEIRKYPRAIFDAEVEESTIMANKGEMIELKAKPISEPAIYNWYDQSGTLIHEGIDFTTSVTMAQKYKLEVIALADGYKDYDEVNVKLKPNKIVTVFPNPVSDQVTVSYNLNDANNAYISITNYYYSHIFHNYILDTTSNSGTFNISDYPSGVYIVTLICNGQIADTKTFVKE